MILTSTLVPGINYFVIITRPLHPILVRKRSRYSVCVRVFIFLLNTERGGVCCLLLLPIVVCVTLFIIIFYG